MSVEEEVPRWSFCCKTDRERDAFWRWDARYHRCVGTFEPAGSPGTIRWRAMGDKGRVEADTAEAVIRKAAGLEEATMSDSVKVTIEVDDKAATAQEVGPKTTHPWGQAVAVAGVIHDALKADAAWKRQNGEAT